MKRIPMGKVNDRVTELEAKYTGALEEIPDLFADGLLGPQAFEDYVEWMGMVHSLRAYREGEDFDYFTEEVLELDLKQSSKLTPRRMELLDQISKNRATSINDLAEKIGRDVKNVYNDLKTLEGLGFVSLVKEGRRLVPELLVQEVTILLW
ncbi:MAG: helix-turn-helix domain-containing protein [Candidatus Bathyarchaeota archaeon]|nr:MAG: helix-turn-helix domain-containing protein [Candidatus Bathyarchaeota archaeon]